MKVSILLSTVAVLLGAASLLLSSPHAPGEAEGLSGGGVMRADASTAEHLRGEVARLIERIEALEADDSTPIEAPIRGRSGPGWVTEEQLEARLAGSSKRSWRAAREDRGILHEPIGLRRGARGRGAA